MFVEAEKGRTLKNGLVAEKLCAKIPSHHIMHTRKTVTPYASQKNPSNVMDGFGCKEYITAKVAPLRQKIMHQCLKFCGQEYKL